MKGSLAQSIQGRLPLGMLGMLALVLLTEHTMARHALDLTAPEQYDWGAASTMARKLAPKCGILGFGDSLVRVGILPQVVEERTGKRMVNLAVFAGQAPSSYFLLRQAIEAGARPEAVVVDFKPNILTLTPRQFIDRWPGLLSPRDALDISWATRDSAFFGATMFGRYLPSVKNYYQIRQSVKAALEGKSLFTRGTLLSIIRNARRNHGAQPHNRNPGFHGEVNLDDTMMFREDWACLPFHETYVRRFFALASERKIRAFWVLPPVAPAVQKRQEDIGMDARYTRFVREIQAAYPNVVVVDARHAGYDVPAFFDATHLNRDGAATLSLHVGSVVDAHLKHEPRSLCWVELPPYVEPLIDVPIEDFEQSVVAVRYGFRGRQ